MTNTNFEGEAAINPQAQGGIRKNKAMIVPWSPWAWCWMATVSSAAPVLDGNVAEGTTLAGMSRV